MAIFELLISYFIYFVFNVIFIFLLSWFLHEFGHYYAFMVLRKKVKFNLTSIGEAKDYKGLNKASLIYIYNMGIIMGLFPIMIAINDNVWIGFSVLALYLVGCKSDIKNLKRINGKLRTKNKNGKIRRYEK